MKKLLRSFLFGLALYFGSVSLADAAAKFLVLCTAACTWDNTNDAIWSTSSGGANNTTHPIAGDTVTLDASSCVGGATCTITVAANLAATSITMGACTASTTGCILDFSANNNNITLSTFSGTGTGTRTLNMGSGTWTLTATTGTIWNNAVVTNFTFNSNTSKILVSGTPTSTRTITGGAGKTINQIELNYSETFPAPFLLGGGTNFTVTTLTLTAAKWLEIGTGDTVTITNGFSFTGTSSAPVMFASSSNGGTATTLSVGGTVTLAWATIWGMTKAGAGSITASNSLDVGGNSGITITPPTVGGGGFIIGGG